MMKPSLGGADIGASISYETVPARPDDLPVGIIPGTFLSVVRKKRIFMAALLAGLALLAIVAMSVGAYDIRLDRMLAVLSGATPGAAEVVIWKIRLPRIASAVVVG